MAIFMNYNDVPGSVTAAGHEKWIELNSMQWGAGRGISTAVGRGRNREASQVSISELVVTKLKDNASPKLVSDAFIGDEGVPVTIHLVTTSDEAKSILIEIILSDTLISGFSFSCGGEDTMESISLNFSKIESNFFIQEEGSTEAGTKFPVTYDLAKAKKS